MTAATTSRWVEAKNRARADARSTIDFLKEQEAAILDARSMGADSSVQVKGKARAGGDKAWDKSYRELKAFHAKFGNCHVPYGKEYGPLRYWGECQKRLQRSNGLERDKLDKLKELDFPF